MNSFDDWKQVVRRNKLVGMLAAEKLGKTGQDAEAYSNALAVGTLDPERSDVLSKIRKDFDAAGVVQSDEQIIQVMDDLMLQAGNLMPTGGGGPDTQTPAGIRPGLSVISDGLVRMLEPACPLWVKSRYSTTTVQCPALLPKADIS